MTSSDPFGASRSRQHSQPQDVNVKESGGENLFLSLLFFSQRNKQEGIQMIRRKRMTCISFTAVLMIMVAAAATFMERATAFSTFTTSRTTTRSEAPFRRRTLKALATAVSASSSEASSSSLSVAEQMGNAALERVEFVASLTGTGSASSSTTTTSSSSASFPSVGTASISSSKNGSSGSRKVDGTGGTTLQQKFPSDKDGVDSVEDKQVWRALALMERDMQFLDQVAGSKGQLSALEATLLAGAVISAASGPVIFGGHITEFLAPAMAAFSAAIGIGAEYNGKVAVADGKEVAAASLQCSAEAEGFLANAERSKAVCPLCVGVGATSATFALLVPVLLEGIGVSNLPLLTELYLFCPLVAILAAAVASLALQDTKSFCDRAIGVGNRRFARSGVVGRTWLSTSEQVERKSVAAATKLRTFTFSVLPAPVLGSLIPGALPTKTIVVAALAAAQSAWLLAQAESVLARATDAVALKSRSAAVCDTYANQGARSAAILPFTSALSSLCAAATAAIVELPFVEALASAGTVPSIMAQVVVVSFFPALAAVLSAAASVSKARCEVDAEAAMQAASTLALQYSAEEDDPVLQPLRGVRELVSLTLNNSIREPLRRFFRNLKVKKQWRKFCSLFQRKPTAT